MQNKTPPTCRKCGLEMVYIKHIEPDGDMGSDESYCACPDNHDQEPHPRVMATDPWVNLPKALELLIDKTILEFKPNTLDDDIPDVLDDWDNRDLAIRYLIEKYTKMLAE